MPDLHTKLAPLSVVLALCFSAVAQKRLPPLKDGAVIDEKGAYVQEGPLQVQGKVKITGIDLDLRGPIRVSAGAQLELDDVKIRVSDPPNAANGASGLRCEGPATIIIRRSTMEATGSAHPIWWLQGKVSVDDFQTVNAEFHLDHVQASLTNFSIFELEISNSSEVVGKQVRLVFLSTHTGEDEKLEFSDIPSKQPFSRKMRMGSAAKADLSDTSAELFLVYVHGQSDVALSRIGRAQLAMFPRCRGSLTLPHGIMGSTAAPVIIPDPKASDCRFRFRLAEVNADTWDVYAGAGADLTFTKSVIDELNADHDARISVSDSEIYADWMSLGGAAKVKVENSTVGAQRLAAQRPDLATSQIRLSGQAEAIFDHVKFDCGIVAGENANLVITDSSIPPKYIRRDGKATVKTTPLLPVDETEKER